jgi:hypothetical protein
MGVIWGLLLIKHLHLIGVYLGGDKRTNTIETHVYKGLDYVFNFYQLLSLNDEHKSGGLVCSIKESTNMHF